MGARVVACRISVNALPSCLIRADPSRSPRIALCSSVLYHQIDESCSAEELEEKKSSIVV